MNRRFRPLFLVATLCAALIAGCGGSSSSSSSSTSSSTSTVKASKTSATTSSASTASSHTTASATSAIKTTPLIPANLGSLGTAIAAYCQTALSAATNLSSTQKSQFKSFCSSLKNDNPTQLKAAEKTLCQEVLKSVPAAYRSIAKAECSKL